MQSIWSETATIQEYPMLRGDISTDVLVIGGGMAGILCAHHLKEAGISCILVEADRVASGVTSCTTAKITTQHGLIYQKLLHKFGYEKTKLYFQANEQALHRYMQLCGQVDCDLELQDSYVYSRRGRAVLEREMAALNSIDAPASMMDTLQIPISTDGAIRFSEQAQFHPIKFISYLVRDLEIYENTAVKQLVGCTAITDHGTVRARKIIVATHFPFINKHGSYFLKLYQHRSYVLALDHVPQLEGMYVDESNRGLSFRMAGGQLLLGGGGHRTGKQGGSYPELEEMAHVYYPNSAIRMRWATQDCMSLDGIPYIGNFSASTPDLYVATGFCKWGMTSSMVAASVLTDLIRGKENAYAHVFSPSRSLMHPQLACNGAEAMINLVTPTKKRCPHLGCALKWNPQEHTWDCPCHGSRFSEDGRLLDNPATGDLRDK